ncbi:hypothetical protein EVAR_90647_1 [Eumeta japonica]|uniref:Uncharacterized protein n=1 Tax=Eumeta variegata TaxID=151549 RepID=A0A4C1T0P8_EUMVA|nr:hypothetical protein EVAR_90647_1 [Eumeta japonica]
MNGRATAPLTHAAPRSPCGSRQCVRMFARVVAFAAYRTAPASPRALLFRFTTRPARAACRRVAPSAVLRGRHRPNTLAATAMDKSKLQAFLTGAATSTSCGVQGILFFPGLP